MSGKQGLEAWTVTFLDCDNETIEVFQAKAPKDATHERVVFAASRLACNQWERAKAKRHRRTLPILQRQECERLARPCFNVQCIHALPLGECVLDHTMKGGMTLADVGNVLGISRERARQIEARAFARAIDEFSQRDIYPSLEEPHDPEQIYEGSDTSYGTTSVAFKELPQARGSESRLSGIAQGGGVRPKAATAKRA